MNAPTPTPPATPAVPAATTAPRVTRVAADVPAASYPDADTVAAAVLGCRGVVGLSGGTFGEVATYLPGRRVAGVRYTPQGLEVHVVAAWGDPLPEIADRVRGLLRLLVVDLPVDVVVDDIVAA